MFVPPDDEGFSVRGDRQKLEYKGRRRSHRFTILGDTAFEYDVILNREPESNIMRLRMEGVENFDFFRQPDFVPDPFLKGSYAVYKKETLLGEGTGKLCHIHRPLIIDARGRRVWGDLAVVGGELLIAIPEQWLSGAVYPVIVDPTIGTTTIGSQITGPDPNNKWYDRPWLDGEYTMNKYLISQNGSGVCTAYVYAYHNDTDYSVTPFLYTNQNDKPFKKKSSNEKNIAVAVWGNNPVGWRNNTFNLDSNISAGEYVWFGIYASWFTTRFDYGGICYKGWFDWDLYPDYDGEPPPYIHIGPWDTYCTIKWSMYFNYTAVTSQNFVRTLTQGVTLTDSRKITANYKRNSYDTVQVNSTANRLQAFFSKLTETVQGYDNNSVSFLFARRVQENVMPNEFLSNFGAYFRGLADIVKTDDEARTGRFYTHILTDTVKATGLAVRGLLLFVRIVSMLFARDFLLRRFLIAKEELVLKSTITREINLESKIN